MSDREIAKAAREYVRVLRSVEKTYSELSVGPILGELQRNALLAHAKEHLNNLTKAVDAEAQGQEGEG